MAISGRTFELTQSGGFGKWKTHEIRPLQPDQARALLDLVRLHRFGALFTVALALGLRQGEALGL